MLGLLALALTAAPLSMTVLVDGDAKFELAVLRSNGTVSWKANGTNSTLQFDGPCNDAHAIRLNTTWPDGTRTSKTTALEWTGVPLRCDATITIDRSGVPMVLSTRVLRPPKELRVTMEDANDSSGFATLVIDNQTKRTLWVASLSIDSGQVPLVLRGCNIRTEVGAASVSRVAMGKALCARPLTPGNHHRRLVLETELPNAVRFEFEFPFTARPGFAPTVLLPNERFDRLEAMTFFESISLQSRSGESVCACSGDLVGTAPHLLTRRGGAFCGLPPDAGMDACESPPTTWPNVGDFPPHVPKR